MNLNEMIYQTVDKIVDSKLSGNDTIKICTIKEIRDVNIGQYVVSDSFSEFIAYSDNLQHEYKINDLVRVSVIKGEYQYTNYILGKYQKSLEKKEIVHYYSDDLAIDDLDLPETDFFIDKSHYLIAHDNALQVKFEVQCQENVGEYGVKITLRNTEGQEMHSVKFTSKDMIGDPYNFKVFTPQNFIYEVPAQYLLPAPETLKVTIQPFVENEEYIDSIKFQNIQIFSGQNPYKRLTLTQVQSTNKSFELSWKNTLPVNDENIGFSDGLGVIDEQEYWNYFFEQQNYLKYLDRAQMENFPKDYNGFDICNKLSQLKEKVNEIINGYNDIVQTLNKNESNMTANEVSSLIDFLIAILTRTGSSSGASLEDNVLISYYNDMYNYYLDNLKNTDNINAVPELVFIDEEKCYLDEMVVKISKEAIKYLYTFEFSATNDQLKYYDQIHPLIKAIESLTEDYYFVIGSSISQTIDDESVTIYMSNLHEQLLRYWDNNYNPNDYALKLIDLTQYDNKYCVYWFIDKKENYDSMAGQGWKFIDGSWNKGIPTKLAIGEKHLPTYADTTADVQENKYTLPDDIQGKSVKVILFYNHIPYYAQTRIQ